jgi:ABC-type Mn2+/Zn2+ transport system ATPase subunit
MTNPLLPYGQRGHVAAVADAAALVCDAVTVGYPGARRPAVDCVSLNIRRGQQVALVGPNGAGKSSLLKAVAGLAAVHQGTIRVFGNAVGACHHRVSYLPQRGDIDWGFPISVERLVLTGRYVHLGWLRWPGTRDRQIARQTLERVGLEALAQRQIHQLSGGQQQRALLARSLAQEADLLLLDEPLTAIDGESRDTMYATLAELRSQGKTIVVATHDVGRLDSDYDVIVTLLDGRCLAGR